MLARQLPAGPLTYVVCGTRGRKSRLGILSGTVSAQGLPVQGADIDVFAGERAMFIPSVGEARLRVSDDTPLFVGIGPSAEVRRYLADGEGSPLEQSFWVHASDGTSTLVDWQIESGEWTAVVMNADGSPGVDATVQASVPSAPLRVAGAILSIIGVGLGAVGTLLVGAAWGGRQYRRPSETMATA